MPASLPEPRALGATQEEQFTCIACATLHPTCIDIQVTFLVNLALK